MSIDALASVDVFVCERCTRAVNACDWPLQVSDILLKLVNKQF